MAATRREQAREQLLGEIRAWADRLLDFLTEPSTPVYWRDEVESPPFWWEDDSKVSEVTDRGLFLHTADEMIRASRSLAPELTEPLVEASEYAAELRKEVFEDIDAAYRYGLTYANERGERVPHEEFSWDQLTPVQQSDRIHFGLGRAVLAAGEVRRDARAERSCDGPEGESRADAQEAEAPEGSVRENREPLLRLKAHLIEQSSEPEAGQEIADQPIGPRTTDLARIQNVFDVAARLLSEHPDWSNRHIAEKLAPQGSGRRISGYGFEAVRQILDGRYSRALELGFKGLERNEGTG